MKVPVCGLRRGWFFLLILLAAISLVAQKTEKTDSTSSDSAPTFRSFTRLVTIQVVAKDRHGRHVSGKLDAKQYQTVAQNGLAHVMAIPAPLPAGVRLLVRDVPTNHIGTVYVNLERATTAKAGVAKPASTKTE